MFKKVCENCGVEFMGQKPTTRFCSKKCMGVTRRKKSVCIVCGAEFAKRAKTCSTACAVELRRQASLEKPRICEACGEEYFSHSTTARYCDRAHYRNCTVCGEKFEAHPAAKTKTCSSQCAGVVINSPEANKKRMETSRKNFGTDFPFQSDVVKKKIVETSLERYGTEHHLQNPEILEKQKETVRKKYGTDWALQSAIVREKAAKTNMERYGAKNPFGGASIIEKIRATCVEKYGTPFPMQNKEVSDRQKATTMEKYGYENVSQVPEFRQKALNTFSQNINSGKVHHHRVSKINLSMAESLRKMFNTDVILEAPLGSFSVDFYIPERDLYIDYHPTITHNLTKPFMCVISGCPDPCPEGHQIINRDYHYQRALTARDLDKSLIQFYQFDNPSRMVSFLHGKLGRDFTKLSARKLNLVELSQPIANEFFNEFHVQGLARGQSVCLGLADDEGVLVAVASFGPARFGNKAQWEFIRFAVRTGCVVQGGAGRLFKKFVEVHEPSSVVSYLDFDHTTRRQTFLDGLGFVEGRPTGPAEVWANFVDERHFSANSLNRLGADRLLGTSYGSRESCGLSNVDIMVLEGFWKLATSGNRVLRWYS